MGVCVTYIHYVRVSPALVGLVVLGVFEQNLVHVRAGVLEEFVGAVEDDEGDLTVAQHTQLVRLLHQSELALGEGHLGQISNTKRVTRNAMSCAVCSTCASEILLHTDWLEH